MEHSKFEEQLIPVPEVSLLTSWQIPLRKYKGYGNASESQLLSLASALTNRIPLHDLYFLGESEIAWYANGDKSAPLSPLTFVANLGRTQVEDIARRLNRELTKWYRGPLVGLRPRFTALATHWPFISLLEEEDEDERGNRTRLWKESIAAIRNSMYLASCLGCRH